ncbi:hypothetical protein E8E13_004273 [Curvularia kusanoi]|uniref:Uncharacterized protein n=1 Tax=Curvularia kusanoi TaxID=90978 RepID=A0A9P4T6D0_CURKU|nr:hypothetical protein E8E13_004273 [Curvularia kusanoi]
MVTTRRQSKDLEPADVPVAALPERKRKRRNKAEPAADVQSVPRQPPTKRQKKVRSTARIDAAPAPAQNAPRVPQNIVKGPATTESAEGESRRQTVRRAQQAKKQSAQLGLTIESDSSADEVPQQYPFAAPQDANDDEDADSRYILGSNRKETTRKPALAAARKTAELMYEEDGLEVIDKADAVLSNTSKRPATKYKGECSQSTVSVSNTNTGGNHSYKIGGSTNNSRQNSTSFVQGTASRFIMFTVAEAIEFLALYKDGTVNGPENVDPQTRQPYEPLQTGEHLSYPVRGTYHLGALGRYGVDDKPSLPFALTVPLSEAFLVKNAQSASVGEPSRRGLGFDSALAARSSGPAVRRPNNHCFTWGKFRGRRVDSVPITYLRSIFHSHDYNNDANLQRAVLDLYPKGLYESEAESYTFEKGPFKNKRLDEVPNSYLWGLLRKKNDGEAVGGKKVKGRLERALEVWEKKQLDLTQD